MGTDEVGASRLPLGTVWVGNALPGGLVKLVGSPAARTGDELAIIKAHRHETGVNI